MENNAVSSPRGKNGQRGSQNGDAPKVEEVDVNAEDNSTEEPLTNENRKGLLKILGSAIGLDITAIALPVTLCEPMSFLTRLCEGIQYSDLLDKAALCDSSSQRLLYVSVFAISFYCAAERGAKPFNPILGETYEYIDEKRNNFKFIAEQVSHHPPIGVCHAETDSWRFWQSQSLKTKFSGNSLDCSVVGWNYVYLKEHKELYKWHAVKTSVNNVILGKLWLDHYGEVDIMNKTTGEVTKLRMKQCGWFSSSGWHELDADVCDTKGQKVIALWGKWNEAVYGRLCSPSAPSTPALTDSPDSGNREKLSKKEEKKLEKQLKKELKIQEKERKKENKEFKKQIKKQLTSNEPIWVHVNKPLDPSKLPPNGAKYMVDWTAHSLQLAELNDFLLGTLPPTDSRLRPDRLALEKGDTKKAGNEKYALEEKQREDKRKRESSGKVWTPKYFKLAKDADGDEYWEYQNNYWEEREKRVQQYLEKQKN